MCIVSCMPFFNSVFEDKPDFNQWQLLKAFVEKPVSAQTQLAEEVYHRKNYAESWSPDAPPIQEKTNSYALPTAVFQPDTVTIAQWEQWGVPPDVAQRMQKYVAKGGKIKNTADLKKIFGFPEDRVDLIGAYIVAEEKLVDIKEGNADIPVQAYTGPEIELNTASTSQLVAVGFTANEANRIVRFREQAGGFYHKDQLYAIFGVDAAHIQQVEHWLHINEKMVILINLNTTDSATLAAHVYISDELAGEIIQYRKTTGKFYSVKELTKVKGVYPALFEKLKPYLRI